MLRPALAATLLLAAPAFAETPADPADGPMRPGAGDTEYTVSDSLAECAAIAAVVSSVTSSRIDRENLNLAAGDWFAISGDVAETEGGLPELEVWEAKVVDWAGRIGSVGALQGHGEWMTYCAHIGTQHGLPTEFFARNAG